MATSKQWEVTVSLTGVVTLLFDEDDTTEIVKQYLGRSEGKADIIDQFRKCLKQGGISFTMSGYPVDIVIDDIELKETT